jgi:hypothetical protein
MSAWPAALRQVPDARSVAARFCAPPVDVSHRRKQLKVHETEWSNQPENFDLAALSVVAEALLPHQRRHRKATSCEPIALATNTCLRFELSFCNQSNAPPSMRGMSPLTVLTWIMNRRPS